MRRIPKLIILRGPSGAGKSTVAKILFENAKRPTVLIEQDHYRFIFKPPGGAINSRTIHKMIRDNILTGLDDGYDVILEGILRKQTYGDIFDELFKKHPRENYVYHFDISFDETLRRHATKLQKDSWGEKEMKEWYPAGAPLGHPLERTISEDSSLEHTVSFIQKETKI